MQQGGERERSTLIWKGQNMAGKLWRGVRGKGTGKEGCTEVIQRRGACKERGQMERKRDERVKEAIIEPVPETDPNGSREEMGRRQRLETDLCGEGEAALRRSQRESVRKEH